MKIFINVVKGFKKTIRVKRLVIFLFLLNLIFSLFLAVPMYHSLRNSFGDSLVGDNMLEGFDYLWWEEFRDQSEGLDKTFAPGIIGGGALLINLENLTRMRFMSLPPVLLVFGFMYILFHTFLAGGILTIFQSENPSFSLKSFFSGAGYFFPSFAAYMLLFWILFFFLAGSLNRWFIQIINRISEDASSEILPFIVELIFSAVILFLIFFFHMIFDYARIKTVQINKRTVFENFFSALKFVMKNPGASLGLYYFILFAGILFSILYVILTSLLNQSNFFWITVGFIIQQLFIFGIIWVRCWLYAGEQELYRYIY